jgi:predicted nucleotidyltransferase
MAKKTILKITHILAALCRERNIPVDKLVLFGSHAGARAHKDSDIDIILVSRLFRNKDIFARAHIAEGITHRLVQEMNAPVDLLYCSDTEWNAGSSLIIRSAKNEGLVLKH